MTLLDAAVAFPYIAFAIGVAYLLVLLVCWALAAMSGRTSREDERRLIREDEGVTVRLGESRGVVYAEIPLGAQTVHIDAIDRTPAEAWRNAYRALS